MTKEEAKDVDKIFISLLSLKEENKNLKKTLSNVITAVEKERKLSGKGKQLPVIKEAYNLLKSLK